MKKAQRQILFLLLFSILGFLALQIKLSPIIEGGGRSFSVFEFLGPTCGMFLTSFYGALAVFLVKFFNALFSGNLSHLPTIIGFFTLPLAAVYFGLKKENKNHKIILLIPVLAILLFIFHPEGRKAWFFSLYWLIPILAYFKKERLISNALGSTFLAHCIGSVAFLYTFNLPASVWISLIPVVAIERGCFALGIWASYLVLNNVLEVIRVKYKISAFETLINKEYLLSSEKFLRTF